MAMTLEELLAQHPVDRARVEEHKERMLAEVLAYRQREPHEEPRPDEAQRDG